MHKYGIVRDASDTARILQQEVADLAERIDKLARQDRLISSSDELTTWKFPAAFGSVNFSAILGHKKETQTDPSAAPYRQI